MNKLYEPQNPHREAVKDLQETQEVLPDLPADVTIPDDARGITHPMRAGGGRAATGIRWMRWMPAILLLVAGAVALGLVLRGDSTDTANQPWTTVTAGPGSNSLAPTPLEGPEVVVIAPSYTNVRPTGWATATYGPGSNSLNAIPVAIWVPWTTPTAGPGSHTLAPTDMTAPTVPWTTPTEGPGSNSLAP